MHVVAACSAVCGALFAHEDASACFDIDGGSNRSDQEGEVSLATLI